MNCPSCGKELPGEFPFCPFCGAPLGERPAAAVQEERKTVSVLFCDLVGFTAASEVADPEDVRARVRPYHARVREEIERYGGTVEKFVGDAVMAVFGAPVIHEDDSERAVRAGLRVLEAIRELNHRDPNLSLQVRVGINTGEAVVAVNAHPERGEGMVTGDVVNTASRLQGAAPVDTVVVSEQTYRQTERVFDYAPLAPVAVKGKGQPLPIWQPLRARARFGSDVIRTHTTPLVGRELEKPLLIGTFERAAQQRSCQLVTIVGEPGIGKSRLCAELFRYIDERPDLVTWRQGRCLPYGEGIAFWALGEIVKAECGILESDSTEEAAAKVERALPQDDPDLPWLRARIASLVGAGGEPASQEESFTAWRRFCESLAAQWPTVLVFEDLHWADEALLAFLEHLADWSHEVPLLLLCTTRPELYERHPTWAAGLRNATTINLAPLTDVETARLIASRLKRTVLPAETQRALLERAGGNPLFAEEFAALLADRRQVSGAADEVPDSVQALIAARVDTLAPERKGLLQDAAVIGKVFWAGALAEMGDRGLRDVETILHELSRKELVRPARTSSMAGEAEYGFWHSLVRDVCYAQIPRAARAARHLAAAAWIERKAGNPADMADVLAHHYLTALETARAAGQAGQAQELERSAIRYLALAGTGALGLDVDRAERNLAKALALAPAGHPERPALLEQWARAAQQQDGRLQEAQEALEEALDLYRERGDTLATARVLIALSSIFSGLGDPRSKPAMSEALALLEAEPPGAQLVDARAQSAALHFVEGAYPETIEAADASLSLASELGLGEPAAALGYRGCARASLGDPEGVADIRRGLELAVQQGQGRLAAMVHNNSAMIACLHDGPEAALRQCRDAIDFCERRGMTDAGLRIRAMMPTFHAMVGHADQALAEARQHVDHLEQGGHIAAVEPRAVELRLVAERGGRVPGAPMDAYLAAARDTHEAQVYTLAFPAAARVALARGDSREAHAVMTELAQTPGIRADPYYALSLPELVRGALAVGDADLAARFLSGITARTPLTRHAVRAGRARLAEADGALEAAASAYAEAAAAWEEFGYLPERAYALLGRGRCLAALGRPEAKAPLDQARALFASMGYITALAEADAVAARADGVQAQSM